MGMKALKDAADEIAITREQQEEIIMGLKNPEKRNRYRGTRRAAGILLGIVCAGVLLSIPAKAVIQSVLKERFGDMPKEEAIDMAEEMDQQAVEADSFSREYTEEEKVRMEELSRDYQKGTFPEQEIAQVKSIEEAEGEEFYFLIPESFFQLPERELTDEELLQIIDYSYKRDYSLAVRYEEEYAGELEEQKAEEQKGIKKITEGGGITQTEAIEIAHGYLGEIFEADAEGMELTYYLASEDEEAFQEFTEPVYVVIYSIRSYVNYYFFINAYDGSLEQVRYSSAEMVDAFAETVNVEDVKAAMGQMYEKALDFLENKLKQEYQYVKATCEYNKKDEILSGIGVTFCFLKEDGSFDKVRVAFGTQDICEYSSLDDYDAYQESEKQNMKLRSESEGEAEAEQDMEHATTIGEPQGDEHVMEIMAE